MSARAAGIRPTQASNGTSLLGARVQGRAIEMANAYAITVAQVNEQLKGHTGGVNSVAFTPDGRILASGSDDTTIILWDVATSHPKGASLKGHTGIVRSVAFTPDGRTLASGSWDNTIILWDVATGQPKGAPLTRHTSVVTSVAFTPDGRTLASGSQDNTIILWEVATGQPKGPPLQKHTDYVRSVTFTPDGRTLASGSQDSTIILWDVATGQPKGAPLKGHASAVYSVAFSPHGRILASGSHDKTIILWDVATGQPKGAPLKGHTRNVCSVAFTPDGRTLASGSWDHAIILWDVATGQNGAPLTGHTSTAMAVAFTPDGHTLASGSHDSTVILWDVATGVIEGTPPRHFASVAALSNTDDDAQHLLVVDGCAVPPGRRPIDASSSSGEECAMLQTSLATAKATIASLRATLETEREKVTSTTKALRREQIMTEGLRHDLAAVSADAARSALSSVAFMAGRPYVLCGAPTTADAPRISLLPSSKAPAVGLLRQFLAARGSHLPGPAPGPVAGFIFDEMQLLGVDAAAFEARLKRLDALRATGGERFNPLTGDFDAEQLRILMTLREAFEVRPAGVGPTYPNMLFAFHGTRVEALPSVVAGLVAMQSMDAGFFGAGVYTTPSLEYAARYAAGRFDDPTTASPRTPRADGCVPVVLVCVAVGVAFPVTPQRDYGRRADGHSDLFGSKLRAGFDAHVAAVSEASRFEAVQRKQMQYLELVIDQEAQVLPLAIVWVRPP